MRRGAKRHFKKSFRARKGVRLGAQSIQPAVHCSTRLLRTAWSSTTSVHSYSVFTLSARILRKAWLNTASVHSYSVFTRSARILQKARLNTTSVHSYSVFTRSAHPPSSESARDTQRADRYAETSTGNAQTPSRTTVHPVSLRD